MQFRFYGSVRCTTFVHNTNCGSTANGILRAIKRMIGKLTGKNKGISEGLKLFSEDIAAGQKAVDEITKVLSEVAKQPRSVPTTEQTEANQIGAKENAAENGDVKSSKKNNTKIESNPPLSGSSETTEGESRTLKSKGTVANNLGIDVSLSQLSDSVKGALPAFSEIVTAIDNGRPAFDGKKKIDTSNLMGSKSNPQRTTSERLTA